MVIIPLSQLFLLLSWPSRMKSFGTFGHQIHLATSSKIYYIFKIILLLTTRPFHTRLFVPYTTLAVTLADLASTEIVSLYLSHAFNGTVVNRVDSHCWQDWSFWLHEPIEPTVTATVTATITTTALTQVTVPSTTTVQPSSTDSTTAPYTVTRIHYQKIHNFNA